MKLYLIRHAPAEEPSQTAPAVDDERALTEKGKARMVRTAAALKRLSVRPELILTSPLRRALETAALVAEGLGNIRVETLAELAPGTEASALSAAIRAHQALNELALVGHQPDLGRLAAS